MDFPVSAGLQWIKQSETPTGSWKKGNYVGETSFKEVRYPKKPISVISFVRTYFGENLNNLIWWIMASLRAHAYSYVYMHWSYPLSCIGTRECSHAWWRKGNVYKAGLLMARSKAKKWVEKYPLISVDFEVLLLHYNHINHCERMRFERSTQKNMTDSMKRFPISYPRIFLKYCFIEATAPLLLQT